MSISINTNIKSWSNNTKQNSLTAGTIVLSGVCANLISKSTNGKNYNWNTSINNSLENFVKSDKNFFGSNTLKSIAKNISKTTSKQKIIGTLALGTLSIVMGIREHFSKEKGKEILKPALKMKDLQIKNAKKTIADQNDFIEQMKSDLITKNDIIEGYRQELKEFSEISKNKDSIIQGYKKTLAEVGAAAKKLNVYEDLKQELSNQS